MKIISPTQKVRTTFARVCG